MQCNICHESAIGQCQSCGSSTAQTTEMSSASNARSLETVLRRAQACQAEASIFSAARDTGCLTAEPAVEAAARNRVFDVGLR
jgi:hypothetical protein